MFGSLGGFAKQRRATEEELKKDPRCSHYPVRIEPELKNVLHCLVTDADVLNYGSYEDWAGSFGYDKDSRKGEAIYKQSLDIGLKLQSGLGAVNLELLREAMQDM